MPIASEPNEESTHASCLSPIAFVLRVVDRETEPKGFHGNLCVVKGAGESKVRNVEKTRLGPA